MEIIVLRLDMDAINKQPVEIFDVKDSYGLYKIAHVNKHEYYLYKLYSPWYGFTNILPNVGNTRDAQRINSKIAQRYAYRLTKEDGKSMSRIGIGVSTIFAQFVFYQGVSANFIMSNMIVFFLSIGMTLITWGIYTMIRYKLAQKNNKLIQAYQPNCKIKLYSSSFAGLLCVFIAIMFVLIASKELQPFLIIFTTFFFVPAIWDIFPDVKSIQNTKNRIKIVEGVTSNESKCSFKKDPINKTIPLITVSFSNYWSISQNIGQVNRYKEKNERTKIFK